VGWKSADFNGLGWFLAWDGIDVGAWVGVALVLVVFFLKWKFFNAKKDAGLAFLGKSNALFFILLRCISNLAP